MTYDEVVQKLATCGLDCNRCADYQDGEIKELSAKLLDLLGGYDRLATLKSTIIPAFKGYGEFKELLELFAHVSCGGCRSENVTCPIDCHAKTCHKEKGVDFCFQCDEFPCDKQFEGKLRERWIANNQRMKEIAVADFYTERSKLPRY
ncbi:MAG: DUF3795 domain-containing protein [Atribacterota bacterium]|nr:DUF3795 domain-containing protein [Atribacterota bacterium]